ncbi:MAG: exodeoxyribonuclease VII small subunit [Gammaproteobacteria bacterium]|nr:exodeoxyribonuclease VII small subunit [Gammaproteobacteria bacterium]
MAKKPVAEQPAFNFEKALAELEQLVSKMEQGDLTLEQSLQEFERGVGLTRHCQQALQEAEQRVEILLQKSADAELSPFNSDEP